LSTVQENLLAAADLLEAKGWIRDALGDDERGYCVVGALAKVSGRSPISVIIGTPEARLLHTHLRLPAWQALAIWNNRIARDKEEVVSTLRAAAVDQEAMARMERREQ
jgi:hypothetical protein